MVHVPQKSTMHFRRRCEPLYVVSLKRRVESFPKKELTAEEKLIRLRWAKDHVDEDWAEQAWICSTTLRIRRLVPRLQLNRTVDIDIYFTGYWEYPGMLCVRREDDSDSDHYAYFEPDTQTRVIAPMLGGMPPVNVFAWDLNPMNDLLPLLIRKFQYQLSDKRLKLSDSDESIDNYCQYLKQIWAGLLPEFRKLVGQMDFRMRRLIEEDGDYLKEHLWKRKFEI